MKQFLLKQGLNRVLAKKNKQLTTKNFLLKHDLSCVLDEINNQSKENKQLITKNFSSIQKKRKTKLLKKLLSFLQEHNCVSFDLIHACFKVKDVKKILGYFNILNDRNLISNNNLMLVLSKEKCNGFAYFMDILNEILSQKSLDLLIESDLVGIKQQISEMLDSVGINDNDSLLKVWEYEKPLAFLKALELFSEDDDIQLETVFKIAECLESEPLAELVDKVYDTLGINVISKIALENALIDEKREKLFNYCKSFLSKDKVLVAQKDTSSLGSVGAFFIAGVTNNAPPVQEETRSLGMR